MAFQAWKNLDLYALNNEAAVWCLLLLFYYWLFTENVYATADLLLFETNSQRFENH